MTAPRLLTGTLPTGERVLVTLWNVDDPLARITGEVAFKSGPVDLARWGAPTILEEMS